MKSSTIFAPRSAIERLTNNEYPLVYWDSGVFIQILKVNGSPLANEILALAKDGQLRIITSSITLVELLRQKDSRYIDAFVEGYLFIHPFVSLVALEDSGDRPLAILRLAREIRVAYSLDAGGSPTLNTVGAIDAVHLATAILCNVQAFHSLDQRRKKTELGLLPLNGCVRTRHTSVPLMITKPQIFQGDQTTMLSHAPGCDHYNREYRNVDDDELDRYRRRHPLFLSMAEASECGYSPCPELCERQLTPASTGRPGSPSAG